MVECDGRLVAQVLGMVRHDDSGYVAEVRTEIDLPVTGQQRLLCTYFGSSPLAGWKR